MELKMAEADIEAIGNTILDRIAAMMGKYQAPLMDVDQLAAHLGVPKGWIYDRSRISEDHGGIPHYKVGKYLRFNLAEVLNWLKANGAIN